MNTLTLDPNVVAVLKARPNARWAEDHLGWFIIDGVETLGQARKLSKAWARAAASLKKKPKKKGTTAPGHNPLVTRKRKKNA
jgi:hypothetical protein